MTGVILFRAQPFHNGHLHMVKKAFEDCHNLHIFIGSADKYGTKRNPLPASLRLDLVINSLKEAFTEDELKNIHVHLLNDMTDEADNSHDWGRYLFYHMYHETQDNDMTIYYSDRPEIMLSWFDEQDRWFLRFKFLDRYEGINATRVRKTLLSDEFVPDSELHHLLPNYVYKCREIIKKYLQEVM